MALLRDIESSLEHWFSVAGQYEIEVRRSVVEGSGATMDDVVELINRETGKDVMDSIRLRLTQFIAVENRQLEESLIAQEEQNSTALFVNFLGTLMIIGFALLLMRAMNRVHTQKLQMQERTQDLSDSDWIQSATETTTRALLDQTGLEDLTQAAVNTISDLLEAEVAAGYLLDANSIGIGGRKDDPTGQASDREDGIHWEFSAGFALQADFDRARVITPGVGRLGQAALDGTVVHLGHNKSTQLVITSAVVITVAKAVTIIPVVFEGQTLAILEFVSSSKPSERQIMLSEKLVGTLGLIFNSFYETRRTEMVLEKSQALTIDLKSRQADLEVAKSEAELANEAKSEFLATVSHEIRTPMNGILGIAQMLRRTEMSEDQMVKLESIITSSKSMTNLLNDILDFSKIEKGMIELDPVDFCPANAFGDLESTFAALAGEKNLDFDVIYDVDSDLVLTADQGRIRQIIWNLVSNAIKFTQAGRVKLTVSADNIPSQRGAAKKVRLKVAVQDTGIGIPTDRQVSIFEAFTQADAGTSRRFGGTGLGLSIVSKLSELMGGTVTLTSEEGVGSKFSSTLVLPLSSKSADEVHPASGYTENPTKHDRELQILIADDQAINIQIAKSFVENMGHKVETVSNGKLAVEAVMAGSFDLVLMDYHMPEMNGDTAARRIRTSGDENSNLVKVIGLTADATLECKNRLIESGMDGVLIKPLDENALSNTISHLFGMKVDKLFSKALHDANGQNSADNRKCSIDFEQLRARLGKARYNDVLRTSGASLNKLAKSMKNITENVRNAENHDVILTALKDVATELGAAELATLALNAERQNAQDAVADDVWAELVAMVDGVREDIKKTDRLAS